MPLIGYCCFTFLIRSGALFINLSSHAERKGDPMRTKAIKAVLLTSLVAVAASFQSTNAAQFNNQSGSNCMAINQGQAFEITWTERGIRNVSTTRSLWITCPVPQVSEAGSGDFTTPPLDVVVHLENTTNTEQTVTCVSRRYNNSAVEQEAVPEDIVVLANSVEDELIEGSGTPADFDFYSLTCKLPPQIGLTHYVNN